MEHLHFRPLPGFTSPHFQTILPILMRQRGEESPFHPLLISLEDGDALYCKMSTPPEWRLHQKTVLMLHGLGGSDSAAYMVRISRKFYLAGYRTLRINLRGCGEGAHYAKKPCHGGMSSDILKVIQSLKKETPESPILLIGFSLGGNIALKLMGELGEAVALLVEKTIAICPPIDLKQTMNLLSLRTNQLYHLYYVKGLRKMGSRWIGKNKINTITDFDNIVTAPQWGYLDAEDYYLKCSSLSHLPGIRQTSHLIFAADDPFVDYRALLEKQLSPAVKVWLSPKGGHMGFFGWAGKEHRYNWLDSVLFKLIHS